MTFEEAKKILKKEVFGIRFKKFDKPLKFEEKLWIRNEKPEVLEALHIVAKNGIGVSVPKTTLRIRSLIIKKMKAGEGEPAPVSGTPLSAAEGMKLRWKDNKNADKNPALAESATQFNDALLDEQAKKIAELTKEKTNLEDHITVLNACKKHNDKINQKQIKGLGKEIVKLNGIIHKKNLKIEELRKESSRHLRGKMKMFGENFDLEQELKDKNAVLADVAEELRLSKIREKNLTEVCQKYVKEVEDLREQLANKVVDKIDAQALKSAESALAWKEKVIAEKDMALAYNEKEIADLQEKLAATKKELEEKTKLVDIIRNASKEYCDYGVAANEFIKELASLYVLVNNNGPINDEMLERCKNYQTYGFPANCNRETKKEINDIASGKENEKLNTAKILDINAKCMRAARESINDVFESYAAKYAKSTLDELKDKAYESFNAKAHKLGLVGSKDGNGIFDQMVGADKAEEGADLSGVIVLCGKDFIDAIKKMK